MCPQADHTQTKSNDDGFQSQHLATIPISAGRVIYLRYNKGCLEKSGFQLQ